MINRGAVHSQASVYALVDRSTRDRTLLTHRRTMHIISHEIENAVLLDRVRGRVFSGFQRLSRFIPQINRYRRLAHQAEAVYVFGIPDVVPPPILNLTYVPLEPADQLAREWFLVVNAPDYFTALATEEITPPNLDGEERLFRGAWLFDEEMVTIVGDWLSHLTGAAIRQEVRGAAQYQRQAALMAAIMMRMTARLESAVDARQTAEINAVVQTQLMPPLQGTT